MSTIHCLRCGRNCSCSSLALSWPETLNIGFFVPAHPHYEIPPSLYCQPFSFASVYMGEALYKCIYLLVWWPTVLNNTSNLSPKLETPFRYAFWPEGNWKEFRYKALDEFIYVKQNLKRFIQLAPSLPQTPGKNTKVASMDLKGYQSYIHLFLFPLIILWYSCSEKLKASKDTQWPWTTSV